MFSGSSLWAENCVQSIYWELLRGYTFKEVWKANWSVCTMGTIEGSADPRVNSRARMAFQNCSKLGQATRPLNPCHRPIIGHISPGRWLWQTAWGSWGKHFREKIWTWSITVSMPFREYWITSHQNSAHMLQLQTKVNSERAGISTSSFVWQINTMVIMYSWRKGALSLYWSLMFTSNHYARSSYQCKIKLPEYSKFWTNSTLGKIDI